MMPPINIRNELTAVSRFPDANPDPAKVDEFAKVEEFPKLLTTPRLKIRSNAPKIRPLTPASESILLVAREKQ